jgi:hypothetical protein
VNLSYALCAYAYVERTCTVSITSVINQVATQPTSKNAALAVPVWASIIPLGITRTPDGTVSEGAFSYSTTSPGLAAHFKWKRVFKPATQVTRLSLRISYVETRTIDSNPSIQYPVNVDIGVDYVGSVMEDTAEVMTALEFAFGLLFKSLDGSTGVPSPSVLDALNQGNVGTPYS